MSFLKYMKMEIFSQFTIKLKRLKNQYTNDRWTNQSIKQTSEMPLCRSWTERSWSEKGSKARERGKRIRRVEGTTPVKTCSFCPSSSSVESEGIHIWNDLFLYKKERSMNFWEDSLSKVLSMAVFYKGYSCSDGKRQSLLYIYLDGQLQIILNSSLWMNHSTNSLWGGILLQRRISNCLYYNRSKAATL